MAQYEAFDQNVEVHGKTILVVLEEALARFSDEYRQRGLRALAENGIEDPDADAWYPQQWWLDTFEAVAEDLEPHLLDRLGEQIPVVADWPNDVASVEDGLRSIDDAYQLNHRGGDIGSYQVTDVDEQTAEIICETPYPCAYDRGIVRAVARQYAPVEAFVFVEEIGDECRQSGARSCTYRVYW